jgi:hypothetical protein
VMVGISDSQNNLGKRVFPAGIFQPQSHRDHRGFFVLSTTEARRTQRLRSMDPLCALCLCGEKAKSSPCSLCLCGGLFGEGASVPSWKSCKIEGERNECPGFRA